ncbi:hypothetical protein [Roseomonas sp. BN140053]|uniref:hypothetical protein n=1 Tax=Roseomonas sp. BN140053 TaxID=3391898 RepID=UPI0039EC16DE
MTDPLDEVLATLLPGEDDWPAGDSVSAQMRRDVDAAPDAGAALNRLLGALPAGFRRGDEATLRAVEAAEPEAFERVVTLAYIAYYTDPAVRAVIERVTGYEARPPQPLGYELPPFDEELLAVQRRRAPFWRDPDAEAGA